MSKILLGALLGAVITILFFQSHPSIDREPVRDESGIWEVHEAVCRPWQIAVCSSGTSR